MPALFSKTLQKLSLQKKKYRCLRFSTSTPYASAILENTPKIKFTEKKIPVPEVLEGTGIEIVLSA